MEIEILWPHPIPTRDLGDCPFSTYASYTPSSEEEIKEQLKETPKKYKVIDLKDEDDIRKPFSDSVLTKDVVS